MADKNMLANRNQLHSLFIHTGSPDDDIATQAQGQAQAGKEKEDREEEGKPRFGQRPMPDDACFGRLL